MGCELQSTVAPACVMVKYGRSALVSDSPTLIDDLSPDKTTLDAAMAMLEPLAGLLLSRQLRHAQAEDLLKAAFVRASARAFAAQGKVPTVSTLSVATGIRRPEVKRVLMQRVRPVAQQPSPAQQALLRWATEATYLDAGGQPRRLPRTAPPGEPSFAALAATVSRDMHARALLDDMLRIGAVEEDGDFVTLRQREYQPPQSEDERMRIAGVNVGDHLSAVLMNLLSAPAPLLERAIHANGLTEASARHGADLARQAWAEVLGGLREKVQTLADLDADAPDNQWRMRIGVYAYYAPEDRSAAPIEARSRPSKLKPKPKPKPKAPTAQRASAGAPAAPAKPARSKPPSKP
jgi:hypothetical protein